MDSTLDTSEQSLRKRDDQPISRFGRFFRAYGIGISLVISALPLATLFWNLLPVFDGAKPLLTTLASGSSFLVVGSIFAQRHSIGRWFFPGLRLGKQRRVAYQHELEWARWFSVLPVLLWFLALICLTLYFVTLNKAAKRVAFSYAVSSDGHDSAMVRCEQLNKDQPPLRFEQWLTGLSVQRDTYGLWITCWMAAAQKIPGTINAEYHVQFPDEHAVKAILSGTPSTSVPYVYWMGLFFLGAFVSATSSFVLTGLKDYLQTELQLSDQDLILQPAAASQKQIFDVKGAPGLYGLAEFSPDAEDLAPTFEGPFCVEHRFEPLVVEVDFTTGKVTKWKHVDHTGKAPRAIECQLTVNCTLGELHTMFAESARRTVSSKLARDILTQTSDDARPREAQADSLPNTPHHLSSRATSHDAGSATAPSNAA